MQQEWKALGSYGTIGLEFAGGAILMLFVGRWLDGKLDTHPWFAFVGMGLGAAAGVRSGYKTLKKANAEMEAADRNPQSRSHPDESPPDHR